METYGLEHDARRGRVTIICRSGHRYNVSTRALLDDCIKNCHAEDRDDLLDMKNTLARLDEIDPDDSRKEAAGAIQ